MLRTVFTASVLLVLAGCSSHTGGGSGVARSVPPATKEQDSKLFDRVAALAGTWEGKDHEGHAQSVTYTVTSNRSVVREVMFPGTPHEMTNMYHMDGPSLVMVHYCAMGNQPNLRAAPADAKADRIEFHFDHVTNMTAPDQMYMGGLTLVFPDADTLQQQWTTYQKGKGDSPMVIELHRKRA
jgi:hypothetical protein